MAQNATRITGVEPNLYLNYNPLLKSDFSKEISYHKNQIIKNEVLAIISLVAFFAIAVALIACAAFFALEFLPMSIALISVGLKIVNHQFFRPCKTEAKEHEEALAIEKSVTDKIKILGDTRTDRFIPIDARYSVLQEKSSHVLERITTNFHCDPKYSDDNEPETYQALKIMARDERNPTAIRKKYKKQLKINRDHKTQVTDNYLELRVHQIFLTYAKSNIFRTGTYNETVQCYRMDEREKIDSAFFEFKPTNKGISRGELLNAHKEMASNIATQLDTIPMKLLSAEDREQIATIISNLPTGTKPRSLYRNIELAPFIEKAVDLQFKETFADYDDLSLRALLSKFLLDHTLKSSKFPEGIRFSDAEIAEATTIASTIDIANVNRETLFRTNVQIKEIVDAKIAALRIS